MRLTAIVDLTASFIKYQETDSKLKQFFLGGRGLGARLLFDRVGPEVEPFDPDNCLIFTTGALSGTTWPTAARYHVTFKSPATGGYGYANAGGHFGPALARAGFDAVIVTGRAAEPVYLEITPHKITIRPANHLWGQNTSHVWEALLGTAADPKDASVAGIGLAGEKLARIAAIINDGGRAAARGGPGAVMGSKRLKALHVRAEERPASFPEFAQAARQATQHLIHDPKMSGLMAHGTLVLMRPKNLSGDLPAKNHQLGQVPFIDSLDAQAFEAHRVKRRGCYACPVRCSRDSKVDTESYLAEIEGPEYETTDALGPLIWNHDPGLVIYANHLCNEYGLDTISTGVVIAFAMECHQRGLLSDPDLSLEWGDPRTIIRLIEEIGQRRGLGDMLADGVRRAAERLGQGAEAFALHVKGLELPRQEPRVAKGFGLGHATSNRGADHLYGLPAMDLSGNWETARKIFPAEIVEQLMTPDDETYKPDMLIYGEHYCAITDSLGICKFSTTEEYSLLPEDLLPGLAALGIETDAAALLEAGERIVNLERLYNVREGFRRKDDQLPRRFTQESLPVLENVLDPVTGQTRLGQPLAVARLYDFDAMLDRYYRLRGWDADGCPRPATLERLGLSRK